MLKIEIFTIIRLKVASSIFLLGNVLLTETCLLLSLNRLTCMFNFQPEATMQTILQEKFNKNIVVIK